MIKKIGAFFGFIVLLIVADEYCISSLGKYWEPDRTRVLDFSKNLARSYSDFSKLSLSRMPCEEVGRFLWYSAEICAQFLITPRDCKQPSATIVFIPPRSTFLRSLVPIDDQRIMAGSIIAIISPDGELCPTQGDH
jgi:hypothetical protein